MLKDIMGLKVEGRTLFNKALNHTREEGMGRSRSDNNRSFPSRFTGLAGQTRNGNMFFS